MKTWATTMKVEVSNELAQDRQACGASICDMVDSIANAGSARPGRMSPQESKLFKPGTIFNPDWDHEYRKS